MADLQPLLAALDVFSRAPDRAQIEQANTWLLDFQHSPEAWTTSNALLASPNAPAAAKLFAAQTFRAKVTFDLHQIDQSNQITLRNTLIECLEKYHQGPKSIIIQLCIALSGLALQCPTWENPVQFMIDGFGRNPATVNVLLQFLTILPEEVSTNTRIPVTDEEYRERSRSLVSDNAPKVSDVLSMYINATGVTQDIQISVLACLKSWLVSGEFPVNSLTSTPLFPFVFDSLDSEPLFDAAIDCLCELIHETQEIDDDMPSIQLIVPRLIAIKPKISQNLEDTDRIRGYARIFTEAGETYRVLLIQHPETFFPIVEAIGECSAHPDLDVVPITFPFWMRLAQVIGKRPSVSPLFHDAYRTLMSVMIRHLHFPLDASQQSAQEIDDFRYFRHNVGDTLKDCCYVLQTETCLTAAYELLVSSLAKGSSTTWQEIEAALFAIRAMGGEFDPKIPSEIIPKVLNLFPSLPNQQQIQYTSLLIISRYTEWINVHPEFIEAQLQYISAGFQSGDLELINASVLALRYICRDCKQHLSDFLPTLRAFVSGDSKNLQQVDRRQIYDAIAHVISAMPMEQSAENLRSFALDLLGQVHLATTEGIVNQERIRVVGDCLENLETMLEIIGSFGEVLPPACQNTCVETWNVMDAFLAKFGSDYSCSERATRVLRHGLTFFGSSCLPIAGAVVSRMGLAFEATEQPGYLWIAGKVVAQFGNEEDPALRTAFRDMFERVTNKMTQILQTKSPDSIGGVLEDYVHIVIPLLDFAPDVLFQSVAFPPAFRVCMASLTVVYSDLVMSALDIFLNILMHDCLEPNPAKTPPPKFPIYATAIREVIERDGQALVGYLLNGLTGDFPSDAASNILTIFRYLCLLWPSHILTWLPPVLQEMPGNIVSNETKGLLLSDVTNAISQGQLDKIKSALLAFDRAARRAKDRRRARFDR